MKFFSVKSIVKLVLLTSSKSSNTIHKMCSALTDYKDIPNYFHNFTYIRLHSLFFVSDLVHQPNQHTNLRNNQSINRVSLTSRINGFLDTCIFQSLEHGLFLSGGYPFPWVDSHQLDSWSSSRTNVFGLGTSKVDPIPISLTRTVLERGLFLSLGLPINWIAEALGAQFNGFLDTSTNFGSRTDLQN